MPLIQDDRHTRDDLIIWRRLESLAAVTVKTRTYRESVKRAGGAISEFCATSCYIGVSWGKDSVAVAGLARECGLSAPLVWVRVEPIANPDCHRVRDAFAPESTRYHEIETWCEHRDGEWHASGTLERGFAEAARLFGDRHVSGIRGEESGIRKLRMMRFGETSTKTCAPIGRWSADVLWAYLLDRELPIHPAYAMTLGGAFEPSRIRVASIGGQRGTGHGRAQWERHYYGRTLARAEGAI